MSYDNILNRKNTIPIILFLTLTSMGLGVNSTYSDSIFTDHILDESPHLGTTIKLDHISEDLNELKDTIKEQTKEIQELKLIICSQPSTQCN